MEKDYDRIKSKKAKTISRHVMDFSIVRAKKRDSTGGDVELIQTAYVKRLKKLS